MRRNRRRIRDTRQWRRERRQSWKRQRKEKGWYVLKCLECGERISTSSERRRKRFKEEHSEVAEHFYDR